MYKSLKEILMHVDMSCQFLYKCCHHIHILNNTRFFFPKNGTKQQFAALWKIFIKWSIFHCVFKSYFNFHMILLRITILKIC